MSQFMPNQNTKNNTKRKLNRKQTKRKRAPAHKKNTQKQNKIQDLFVYNSFTCFLFLIPLINAEPTSQSVQIFPFRTHTILPTKLKSSLPLQNQFNTSTTLTIRHLRPQQTLYTPL